MALNRTDAVQEIEGHRVHPDSLPIPEWGEGKEFRVLMLSADEVKETGFLDMKHLSSEEVPAVMVKILSAVLCNDEGELLFPPGDDEGLAILSRMNFMLQGRLVNTAMDMNGLGDDAKTTAEKSFGKAQDESDSSD